MHPRNPYQNRPDFKELALKFPQFRMFAKQKLSGKIEIDFKDPAAVSALTSVLLQKDFNLIIDLPPGRLIPTLPLRLNYLLWIEDLLAVTGSKSEVVRGLDIGTGACCIYPILGTRKNKWLFTATEADQINYESSLKTIEKNNLKESIAIRKVDADSLLIGVVEPSERYDFSMCNPPFFDSDNLVPKTRTAKRPLPICPKSGGSTSASEIAVKGGEVEFLRKLVNESKELESTVFIFTTMMGHKSSLDPVKKMIQEAGAASVTHTEFSQGRTMRWGLAWTFSADVSLSALPAVVKPKVKQPFSYVIDKERWSSEEYSVTCLMTKIKEQLDKLTLEYKKAKESKNSYAIEFVAKRNTWANQRRLRREEKSSHCANGLTDAQEPEKKRVKMDPGNEFSPPLRGLVLLQNTDSVIKLQMEWLEGGHGRESVHQIMQYIKNNLFHQ